MSRGFVLGLSGGLQRKPKELSQDSPPADTILHSERIKRIKMIRTARIDKIRKVLESSNI